MTKPPLHDSPVNPRTIISAYWTAMLFVFAYVDIFSLFRKDVIDGVLDQKVSGVGFTINQTFLTATTGYIVVPCLMVVLVLTLPAKVVRPVTLIVGGLYVLTIAGSMIGETWIYYLMGSIIEIALLVAMMVFAWRWPRTP